MCVFVCAVDGVCMTCVGVDCVQVSTMLDWGYPKNTAFKQLKLNHDATALWGLG